MKLGTLLETALSQVGLTEEKVSGWLGKPCHCKERKEKLDRLSLWAAQTVRRRMPPGLARDYLEQILS